ncbi:MAG TPA: hypothetical protein PLQ00_14930, partial [Thermoguttaceae bacterium]|nr:hypothetical protein [Thermoguttaceae bacterium]
MTLAIPNREAEKLTALLAIPPEGLAAVDWCIFPGRRTAKAEGLRGRRLRSSLPPVLQCLH